MSIALMTSAFKTQLNHTHKFVLVALCDNANDQGECYPSVSMLCEKTSLSDRAVQKSIAFLVESGYMKRDIRNGRSTYYYIADPRTWFTPECSSPPNVVRPTSEPHSPPPPNTVHPTPERGSPITINEPSIESSGNQKQSGQAAESKFDPMTALLEAGVDVQVAGDWIQLRKKKRADVSLTVLREHITQAGIAGLTLNDALRMSCLRGWQGFDASFVKPQVRTSNAPNDLASINARNNAEAKRLLGITDDDMRTINA